MWGFCRMLWVSEECCGHMHHLYCTVLLSHSFCCHIHTLGMWYILALLSHILHTFLTLSLHVLEPTTKALTNVSHTHVGAPPTFSHVSHSFLTQTAYMKPHSVLTEKNDLTIFRACLALGVLNLNLVNRAWQPFPIPNLSLFGESWCIDLGWDRLRCEKCGDSIRFAMCSTNQVDHVLFEVTYFSQNRSNPVSPFFHGWF